MDHSPFYYGSVCREDDVDVGGKEVHAFSGPEGNSRIRELEVEETLSRK
jgi:hypothetical protein